MKHALIALRAEQKAISQALTDLDTEFGANLMDGLSPEYHRQRMKLHWEMSELLEAEGLIMVTLVERAQQTAELARERVRIRKREEARRRREREKREGPTAWKRLLPSNERSRP